MPWQREQEQEQDKEYESPVTQIEPLPGERFFHPRAQPVTSPNLGFRYRQNLRTISRGVAMTGAATSKSFKSNVIPSRTNNRTDAGGGATK